MKPIQIKGCEHYSVNEEGVVVNTKTGKVLKTDLTNVGYKRVTLWSVEQKAVRLSVHRLVALHFIDNPNEYPMVNHKDGNKLNNHYRNLQWCTCSQNTVHAFKHGLRKDTKKQVSLELAQKLRDEWKQGTTRKELIDSYGVPKHVIDEILYNRRSYKYLK